MRCLRLFAALVAAPGVFATPVATVGVGPGTLNGVALCGFPDDSLSLVVTDGPKDVVRYDFCSSYGKASARLVQDVKGQHFILLESSEGRGTNATADYLTVFGLERLLVEYIRTPLSGAAGPFSRWSYDYKVDTPSSGGLRFVLTLSVDGDDPSFVPGEKQRVIEVGGR